MRRGQREGQGEHAHQRRVERVHEDGQPQGQAGTAGPDRLVLGPTDEEQGDRDEEHRRGLGPEGLARGRRGSAQREHRRGAAGHALRPPPSEGDEKGGGGEAGEERRDGLAGQRRRRLIDRKRAAHRRRKPRRNGQGGAAVGQEQDEEDRRQGERGGQRRLARRALFAGELGVRFGDPNRHLLPSRRASRARGR